MKDSRTDGIFLEQKAERKPARGLLLLVWIACLTVLMSGNAFASNKPAKVKKLKAKAYEKSVQLTWEASSDASGYEIYMRKAYMNGSYKLIARIKKKSTTQYLKKKLKIGKKYSFYIVAYKKKNGKKYYSAHSNVARATTKVLTPDAVQGVIGASISKQAIFTWKAVYGATGYDILQKTNGKYHKIKTVKKPAATIKNLKNGTTYTFRIRAIREKGGYKAKGKGYTISIKVETLETQSQRLITRDIYSVQITETATLDRLDGNGSVTLYAGTVCGVAWKNYEYGDSSNDHVPLYFVLDDGTKLEGRTGICTQLDDLYWNHSKAFGPLVAEYYVNVMYPQSSESNWMLWINYYTQYCYVFRRTKVGAKWKHYATWETATGKYGMTQTPRGELSIVKKSQRYYFPKGGGAYGLWASHLTGEGNAIHGPRRNSDGSYIDPSEIGYPISSGCARLMDEYAKFVYDNMPLGTRVLVA